MEIPHPIRVRQQSPSWVKDRKAFKASMFNARSESAAEKSSFKGPLRYKRAVIPASGFFEWLRRAKSRKWLLAGKEGSQELA